MSNDSGTTFLSEYPNSLRIKMQAQEQKHEQALNQQNNAHEAEMQEKANEHEKDMQQSQFAHEKEIKEADLGLIGKLFGSAENLSKNIAATFLLVLLICIVILTIILWSNNKDDGTVIEILKALIPLLSLTLGYIFGKK